MTVITCGRTNLSDRAEAITRHLREAQGFCLDIGCGRAFDLDNQIQHMGVYRCLECARWLCKPCIVAHFEATNDAYQPARSARVIAPAQNHEKGGHTVGRERGDQTTALLPAAPSAANGHEEAAR